MLVAARFPALAAPCQHQPLQKAFRDWEPSHTEREPRHEDAEFLQDELVLKGKLGSADGKFCRFSQ